MGFRSMDPPKICLVISHYNAWPTNKLFALLDQTLEWPSGAPFHTRVVVNQAVDRRLDLPERFAHVEVMHRPNTGYNIGAWDHGWREGTPYSAYLFLQEECRILRKDWIKAFECAMAKPEVGLVGESIVCRSSWERLTTAPPPVIRGVSKSGPEIFIQLYDEIQKHGVAPGRDGLHLQSLVLAARRDVLERIDGFPMGGTWLECVAAEVAISKRVIAAGLEVKQISDRRRFKYVVHPQWEARPLMHKVKNRLARIPASSRRIMDSVRWALQPLAGRLAPGRLALGRQA